MHGRDRTVLFHPDGAGLVGDLFAEGLVTQVETVGIFTGGIQGQAAFFDVVDVGDIGQAI
jgi:hypothetical protein